MSFYRPPPMAVPPRHAPMHYVHMQHSALHGAHISSEAMRKAHEQKQIQYLQQQQQRQQHQQQQQPQQPVVAQPTVQDCSLSFEREQCCDRRMISGHEDARRLAKQDAKQIWQYSVKPWTNTDGGKYVRWIGQLTFKGDTQPFLFRMEVYHIPKTFWNSQQYRVYFCGKEFKPLPNENNVITFSISPSENDHNKIKFDICLAKSKSASDHYSFHIGDELFEAVAWNWVCQLAATKYEK